MKLSRKQLENMKCIACSKPFGKHTKKRGTKFSIVALMECMFRIQATFIAEADKSKAKDVKHEEFIESVTKKTRLLPSTSGVTKSG